MKIIKIILGLVLVLLLLLVILYFIGPKPEFSPINYATSQLQYNLLQLDSVVKSEEHNINGLKPNNEARIIWADSVPKKTEYSVVYLHGFSASQMEGHPVHINFAKRYGCNIYLSRLAGHGVQDSNAFKTLTPDDFFESAQKALSIGKLLGNKVNVMSCSTGSTLAIMLAETNPEIHSFIMYSPNIDIKDPMSYLSDENWGPQLTELVLGSEYNHIKTYSDEAKKYWNEKYHINGIVALKRVIKDYMNDEHFKKINQPLFMGYYYKDEEHQDQVVSVPRMLEFYNAISTPLEKKRKVNFTDSKGHVFSSIIMNPNVANVEAETYKFAEEVLGLKKKE